MDKLIDFDVADQGTDTIASADEAGDGEALTLLETTPGDGFAHKVILTPSGSVSDSYTITGTDADGKAQTETLATDTTNAVTSAKYYGTLTEILNCTAGSETIDAGWTDDAMSQTYQLNRLSSGAATIVTVVTGTIDYDIQMLIGVRVGTLAKPLQDGTWIPITAYDGKTAGVQNTAPVGASAIRILSNSYTDTAEVQVYISQPIVD